MREAILDPSSAGKQTLKASILPPRSMRYADEEDARRVFESGEEFTLDGRRLGLEYAQALADAEETVAVLALPIVTIVQALVATRVPDLAPVIAVIVAATAVVLFAAVPALEALPAAARLPPVATVAHPLHAVIVALLRLNHPVAAHHLPRAVAALLPEVTALNVRLPDAHILPALRANNESQHANGAPEDGSWGEYATGHNGAPSYEPMA
ncbi:hypothetical protein BGZ74_000616 [Mortierella antarctica]|nr:hypothetical protein BGZ74_000616 [Mortierella antarctica]